MKVRFLIPAGIILVGCTPAQRDAWVDWFHKDPVAAVEFAKDPRVQADLADDTIPPTTNANNQRARRENNSNSTSPPLTEREATPVTDRPSQRTSTWDRIAYCESGGNWHYPPVTNRTGTYSGGLMIWQKAWVAYGGTQFASWAYLASKGQQIVVAERILADRGWRAWDCA